MLVWVKRAGFMPCPVQELAVAGAAGAMSVKAAPASLCRDSNWILIPGYRRQKRKVVPCQPEQARVASRTLNHNYPIDLLIDFLQLFFPSFLFQLFP